MFRTGDIIIVENCRKNWETFDLINIKGVANHAGVSASTVSRVLSGKENVNEETRKLVLAAVKELGYVPNALAKSLKNGRTNMISLLIPSIQNHIFPEIARGVEDVARKKGFSVILGNTDDDAGVEIDYIEKLCTHWTDGFIVSSFRPDSDHIRALKTAGVPLVLTTRHFNEDIDAVAVDNRRAAYEAVAYLIKTGHKRIGIALGTCKLDVYQERFEGYKKALNEAGLPLDERFILHEGSDTDSLYYLTSNMLSMGNIPDAIFATSDPKAIVVMRAILDAGYRIPEDISVIGFDNIKMSAMLNPSLTTVSQPLYKIGALAMEKLIAQIEAKEAGKPYIPMLNILPTELVIRNSTR